METKDLKYIIVAVLVIVGAGATLAFMNRPTAERNDSQATATSNRTQKDASAAKPAESIIVRENQIAREVIYNSHGFIPKTINANKGDVVKFINQTGGDLWVASDPHPTHTAYPNTNSATCGTPAASKMFDSCKNIKMGDSYVFIFDETGTWKYHNHANPKDAGVVIVK